jgi:hypothetical protein
MSRLVTAGAKTATFARPPAWCRVPPESTRGTLTPRGAADEESMVEAVSKSGMTIT